MACTTTATRLEPGSSEFCVLLTSIQRRRNRDSARSPFPPSFFFASVERKGATLLKFPDTRENRIPLSAREHSARKQYPVGLYNALRICHVFALIEYICEVRKKFLAIPAIMHFTINRI